MKKKQIYPPGYWNNKIICQNAAKKFNRRSDFNRNEPSAASAAKRNGWYDEITGHMIGRKKFPPHYFDSLDHCMKVASMYTSWKSLRKNDKGCYEALKKHPKWIAICTSKYEPIKIHYKNIELKKICEKYNDYNAFRKSEPKAFAALRWRGLTNEYCSHMRRTTRVHYDESFTYEECKRRAHKYTRRVDFQKGEDKRFATFARKMGWFDDICHHMERVGSDNKRCVYSASFSDSSIYIGLTFNTHKRWNEHMKDSKSAVFIHMNNTGLMPEFKQLTDYLPKEEASTLECEYIIKFKKLGWTILNRAKAGSLGGNLSYTKEEVFAKAREYSTLKEFRENAAGYYECGYRSDYWDEIRKILEVKSKKNRLNYDTIKLIAASCKTMCEFRKKDAAALEKARKMGILDEICKHFDRTNERHCIKISENEKIEIIESCPTWKELRIQYPHVAKWLSRNNLVETYYSGQRRRTKPYSEEEIMSAIYKCKYKFEFIEKYHAIYSYLFKHNLLKKYESCFIPAPKGRHSFRHKKAK